MTEDEQRRDSPRRADRTPILALLSANAISTVGNNITALAVPWFILETTGSAARTGLVGATIAFGLILGSVLGGPVVDRLGFKRASVLADVASSAAVLAIPLLYRAGVLAFWQLLILAFLVAAFNAPGDAARLSLVPGLARRAAMPIERANAADRAIARGSLLVGPLVAGVLIVLIGPTNVLILDAATFAASAVLVGAGVRSADGQGEAAVQGRRTYASELLVGLRFIAANRLILSMALVATAANALDAPLISVVLPVYAKEIWNSPASLGAVVAAVGAGGLAGTLLYGAIGHRLPRRLTFLGAGAVGSALLFGVLATTPPLPVVVLAAFAGGLIGGPILPLMETVIQQNTPPEMYGRTFGALQAVTTAAVPFTTAAAGFVTQGAGLVPTILGMAVLYLVLTLGMFLNPALRRMDAVPAPSPGRARA